MLAAHLIGCKRRMAVRRTRPEKQTETPMSKRRRATLSNIAAAHYAGSVMPCRRRIVGHRWFGWIRGWCVDARWPVALLRMQYEYGKLYVESVAPVGRSCYCPVQVSFEILGIYLYLLCPNPRHLSRRDKTCPVAECRHLSRNDKIFGSLSENFCSARFARGQEGCFV